MAVTLKDIAERTGVSPSVVSTVLSGRDNGTFVSEQTRRKVLEIAELLNYTPVRSGRPRGSRRLRRQRVENFIGIWDPDYSASTAHHLQNLQGALRRHAEEAGATAEDDYGLRLLTTDDLPRLDALGIMGLVLLRSTLLPREAAAASIPCVMIGEVGNPPRELIQIHPDNFHAGRLLGEHLWEQGHRRISFLAPGAQPRVANRRYQGLKSIWEVRGDPAQVSAAQYDKLPQLPEREQVRRTVLALIAPEIPEASRPTALVCYDEDIAAIAAQALFEAGLRVPADISLAGFGDTPRGGEALIPPLTTVRHPVSEMAGEAIQQLYRLHDAEDPDAIEPRDFALPGELVVRASTAPVSPA